MCFASTSFESNETTRLSEEPLPGPSSEISTTKKRKLLKEVARLRTKVCRFKKQKKYSTHFTTQDMRIKHIMSQLSPYLPDNTISFIETQIRMSKRSKHGKQWSISDKMLALSIFYHSQKAIACSPNYFVCPQSQPCLDHCGSLTCLLASVIRCLMQTWGQSTQYLRTRVLEYICKYSYSYS